jgi:hypothetical protein
MVPGSKRQYAAIMRSHVIGIVGVQRLPVILKVVPAVPFQGDDVPHIGHYTARPDTLHSYAQGVYCH